MNKQFGRHPVILALSSLTLLASCAQGVPAQTGEAAGGETTTTTTTTTTSTTITIPPGIDVNAPIPMRDPNLLTLPEARAYMLKLINKDRSTAALPPVKMDSIATVAAQRHAEEMAQNIYLAHWDMQGKKPWERYNDAGGKLAVAENVAFMGSTADEDPPPKTLPLAGEQFFTKSSMEALERSMYEERPPADGHRKNILDPHHTGVGIGMAVAASGGTYRFTLDQEFTDDYGIFGPLPRTLVPTRALTVSGTMAAGVTVDNVLVQWEPTPRAMKPQQLNKTHSYDYPQHTLAVCYRPPSRTVAPIEVKPAPGGKQSFSVTIPPMINATPGIYYVIVWAHKNSKKNDPFIASVRTLSLGPRVPAPAIIAASTPSIATMPLVRGVRAIHQKRKGTDLRTLFFHPESVGSRVIAATTTAEDTGPPDPRKLFFRPGESDQSSAARESSSSEESSGAPDPRSLFAQPSLPSKSDQGARGDRRSLFFKPR